MTDPIEQLARDDKWQLGGGDGTLFAPAFPEWLEAPGFWDGGRVLDHAFAPLFAVTLLDDAGREFPARAFSRRWTCAELTLRYRLPNGIRATEVRTVNPGGVFVSEWQIVSQRPLRVHLVAWTVQEGASVDRGSAGYDGALGFTRSLPVGSGAPLRMRAEIACVGGATSWATVRAERGAVQPHWRLTPFPELWLASGLPSAEPDERAPLDGVFYAAVHRVVDVEYAAGIATFAMRVAPATAVVAAPAPVPLPAAAPAVATRQGRFAEESRRRWAAYFSTLPALRCSDPYVESAFLYRWAMLRLGGLAGDARELRWLADPAPARRALRAQLRDDSADAFRALDAAHPDADFVRETHAKLAAVAESLVATRDPAASGMFDASGEFGDPEIRRAPGSARTERRLKGIAETVQAYQLFRTLEALAERVGRSPETTARWTELADRTRIAVQTVMWDAAQGMFSDVDAETRSCTGVRTALCFTPYGTDLVDSSHVPGLERHLLNPNEFWTAFPVPSLALDDERFSAEGMWQGRRAERPSNGRAWPSFNGRVVDALAHVARRWAPQLRPEAATLTRRCIRTMFQDGELQRVHCAEHYNPVTGHASLHRGVEDVHSTWTNDLILRHVVGIIPQTGGMTIDPLPLRLESIELTGLQLQGHTISVRIREERVSVTVDAQTFETTVGTPLDVPFT